MRQWITFGVSLFASLSVVTSSLVLRDSTVFDALYVFGDSYSDNGSLDKFYSNPTIDVPNSAVNGTDSGLKNKMQPGSRRTNGPLLVEYLSSSSDASLYDFARSGATVLNSIVPRQTEDVNTQTQYYLKSKIARYPKKNSLFLTWIGVNDIHDLFVDKSLSQIDKDESVQDIIQTIQVIMNRIYNNGGEKQVILGLIPIGQLPLFNSLNNVQRRELEDLIDQYNEKLRETVIEFNEDTGGSHALFVDLHSAYLELYGETKEPSKDCSGQSECKDLLWWDDWHPTNKVHRELAEKTIEALASW